MLKKYMLKSALTGLLLSVTILFSGCLLNFGDSKVNYSISDISIDEKTYPSVVVGGGVGGLTASIYLAQSRCHPLVLEGSSPGGALAKSHSVRNWPGVKDAPGGKIVEDIREHAQTSGAKIDGKELVSCDLSQWPFKLEVKNLVSGENEEIKALSCVVATGASPRYLGIPGETGKDGYWGRGVSNCATCDGGLFGGRTVAIVGAGDSAIVEADYLASIGAKEIHVIVRKDKFKASGKVKEKVLARPNVKVIYNTVVNEIVGDGKKVTKLMLTNSKSGESSELAVDGLFLAIGSVPNSAMFKGQLELAENGSIVLKHDQETSVQGVFSVGDVSDSFYRQAVSSAGEGARAAIQALDFLRETGFQYKSEGDSKKVEPKKEDKKSVVKKAEPAKKTIKTKVPDAVVSVVDAQEFEKDLKDLKIPMIADFYASWCMPCKLMHPIFDELAKKYSGKVRFYRVNVDEVKELASKYEVQGIPTFIFVDSNGQEVTREVGAMEKADLEELVKSLIG
jgi:thioredoxin reductase (NADPH)